MWVIKPVDIVYILVCFCSEADWFDMQICKSFVFRITYEFLSFDCHVLRVNPRTEHLSVKRRPPWSVHHFVCIFEFYYWCIWLDLCYVKEHFIDFLIGVNMRTSKIVRLTNWFFHSYSVQNSKSNIVGINRLNFCIHTIDSPVHAIVGLQLHTPFARNSGVLFYQVHHVSGS